MTIINKQNSTAQTPETGTQPIYKENQARTYYSAMVTRLEQIKEEETEMKPQSGTLSSIIESMNPVPFYEIAQISIDGIVETFHDFIEQPNLPNKPNILSSFTPVSVKSTIILEMPRFTSADGSTTIFLPAQHFCFGYPLVIPEKFPLHNSLKSLAAHKNIHWPSSRKSIVCNPGRVSLCFRKEINGDYHYIYIKGLLNYKYSLLIQCTDYDLFCLTRHNNTKFGSLIGCVGNTSKYMIVSSAFRNYLHLFAIFSPREAWNMLFYDQNDFWCSHLHFLSEHDVRKDMIHILKGIVWDDSNQHRLLKILPYMDQCDGYTENDISKYKFYRHSKFVKRFRRKFRREIIIQGATMSNLGGMLESVNEIGKFAKTANGVKDSFTTYSQQPWFQYIMSYITSIAQNITGLIQDFIDFQKDPQQYIKDILKGCKFDFKWPENMVYDSAKIAMILGAAIYLFEKSQIISVGLFLFGYHGYFRNCYTDLRYARSAAIVTTLVSIGVMKATQLRPVSISLQSTGSLTAMIYAMSAFITLGFAGRGISTSTTSVIRHLFNNTKDIFALSKGSLALSKCIEFIVESIQTAFNYVFGTSFVYSTLVTMTVTSKDLQEYIQYCLTTQPEDLAIKLTLDFDSRRQWERICILHKDLIQVFASGTPPTETHIGYSMYVRACAAFGKLRQEFDKVKDSLDHFRPEPFMVWIWGKPGTGKTWCRDRFVNNMYRWHSKIDPTLPDVRRTGLLYVRNPADKFASKYNGEFAFAYDDVGQNRQQDNPEFNEIMGFGSTNQVRMNMADLEDKGKLFSSKVVIMAANSKTVSANNLILKEEAFNRRRHIVVEIDRPLMENDDLSTSKCDFSKVALTLTDPITGDFVKRFPEEGYGEDEATFMKLFEWLAPRYIKHVEDQTKALEDKERALYAVLNGDEDDSILDINLAKEELPGLHPALDRTLGKFRKIAKMIEFDDTFRCVLEGFKNCYQDNGEITPLLKSEFERMCEEYDIEQLTAKEWNFLVYKTITLKIEEMDAIQDMWDEQMGKISALSPWVGFLKSLGLVASGFALYKMCSSYFSGEEDLFDLQGYNQEPRAQPTPRVAVQQYNLETRAQRANKVVIQNKEDLLNSQESISDIENLSSKFAKATARFTKRAQNSNFYIVNGFNVCYNIWLLPRHFFGKTISDTELMVEKNGERTVITITTENIHPYVKYDSSGVLREKDLCFVRIPSFPHGKNFLKHFAKTIHIQNCRNFNGKLIRWNPAQKRPEDVYLGEVLRWDRPIEILHDGTALHYANGYKYNLSTNMGDCGAILMSLDTTTPARIYGVHFGFDNIEKRGLSCNIPREDIEQIIDLIVPKIEQINANDPEVEIQQAECPPDLIKPDGDQYFEHLGYVRDGPLPPKAHGDLHRSPLFDQVYPAEKDLSVLSKFDPRMDEDSKGDPDILTRGVVDFSYESKEWPEQELKIATEALTGEMREFKAPLGKRILTQDEAICGVWCDGARVEFSEPLNLKTSAGYGLTGVKRDHFKTEEKFEGNKLIKIEHTVSNPKLQQQIDDMWNAWMDGETYSIPWSHTLKVEALKLSKIKSGNTRTFCVASTAFLINVRRLFGSFTTAMKSSKVKSFSCLGVDANSQDWNDLYNNLVSTGLKGADMDFFKFDRTAVTYQLAKAFCDAVNEWYDDTDQLKRARIIAVQEMVFAYCLVNKHLTRKRRGNPSGNPLTTELNNCVNYLMLCMVFLLIAKEKKPENYSIRAWKRLVNMKAYGDDIIFTLHPEAEPWFCFNMLAEIYANYGVPVTPADKSDNGITLRPLHELTFLKRNFIPFDHPFIKWQSGLSKTSIRSMIQFYRLKTNNGTIMDAVLENCHESLVEAYHWGQDFFEEHKKKINNWMVQNDYTPLSITFKELDVIYRSKLEAGY